MTCNGMLALCLAPCLCFLQVYKLTEHQHDDWIVGESQAWVWLQAVVAFSATTRIGCEWHGLYCEHTCVPNAFLRHHCWHFPSAVLPCHDALACPAAC